MVVAVAALLGAAVTEEGAAGAVGMVEEEEAEAVAEGEEGEVVVVDHLRGWGS